MRMQGEGQGQGFSGSSIPSVANVITNTQSRPLGPDGTPMRRNLDEVLCFKVRFGSKKKFIWIELTDGLPPLHQCGQYGHYANTCTNRNVPGNRGGLDRRSLPNQE